MKKIALSLLLVSYFLPTLSEQNDVNQHTLEQTGIDQSETDAHDLRINGVTQNSSSTWTQPLIIDANNPNFNTNSVYQLQNNIVYNPGLQYSYPSTYTDYPAAIIIAKDNITIDLNGFNLSLAPTSSANFLTNSPTYGIAVYEGAKNVKIISSQPITRKGSITGFSGYAIYAAGNLQSYNTYDIYSNYIKNLVIDNILITQNINGMYILNALEVIITNTHVVYNFSPRILSGIYASNILNGFIELCRINQNFSFTDVFGMILEDTTNVTVQNSEISVNRSIQNGNATGLLITAFSPISVTSSANTISNCSISRNQCSYTANKKSIGINVSHGSVHNLISDCNIYLHGSIPSLSPAPTPAPLGIGIQLDATNFNQINNNRSGYNDTYGISDTASVSTSFFTKNFCALNLIENYNVIVPHNPSPIPLPTIILFSSDLDGYTGAGPILSNLETRAPS